MTHAYLFSSLHFNAVLSSFFSCYYRFQVARGELSRLEPTSFYTALCFSCLLWESPWLLVSQNASGSFWIFAAQTPEPTTSPQPQLPQWLLCFAFSTNKLRKFQLLYVFNSWHCQWKNIRIYNPMKFWLVRQISRSNCWELVSEQYQVCLSLNMVHLSIDLYLFFCIRSVLWNFQYVAFQRLC